jgi:hypothetical protein
LVDRSGRRWDRIWPAVRVFLSDLLGDGVNLYFWGGHRGLGVELSGGVDGCIDAYAYAYAYAYTYIYTDTIKVQKDKYEYREYEWIGRDKLSVCISKMKSRSFPCSKLHKRIIARRWLDQKHVGASDVGWTRASSFPCGDCNSDIHACQLCPACPVPYPSSKVYLYLPLMDLTEDHVCYQILTSGPAVCRIF